MDIRECSPEDLATLEKVLGYLNFSSGTADPRFLAGLNRVFELAEPTGPASQVCHTALNLLRKNLTRLQETSPALQDSTQASAVLELVQKSVLPGYLEFHSDLLFHQNTGTLFNSFFVGRVLEAVLTQGPPWDETDRICRGAIRLLNDYIGYRPVAVLESQKIEPYAHEWLRPVPLYVTEAGSATGRYQAVVDVALDILCQTDADIQREACFDPDLLGELAFDPRAYDFDHPVNKRPNYHFGQWDPHHIDQRGFYRRYVIQQITLDALMTRVEQESELPAEELLFEAAAVLAGTIIMSTGISGAGPDSHDSTVTLANLLPRIAGYRDTFYERLLSRLDGPHGERLREEAARRRQPFGGARQHLNAELAKRRASQLEHVHLAAIFARMGFPDAAAREANVVPAVSARMLCHIDCRLADGDQAVTSGDLTRAKSQLDEAIEWLRRGIGCGAIIDPWNILGFDANFSLFPALENSVRDHRADELVSVVEHLWALYSRVWSEAAARDAQEICQQVSEDFQNVATWWRQYAAHEVSSVDATDSQVVYLAAQRVANALNLWHKGGASTENVRFWAPHADIFDSANAYALVVTALLERKDFVASMALIMHWLSQADRVPLEEGETSFFDLAERWMVELRHDALPDTQATSTSLGNPPEVTPPQVAWGLARKFLDYLEANAGEFWEPPQFELVDSRYIRRTEEQLDDLFSGDDLDDEDNEEDLFGAAYEDVVYRDSTDDGIDSGLAGERSASDDQWLSESRRLGHHLSFDSLVARLWQLAITIEPGDDSTNRDRCEVAQRWIRQAGKNRENLQALMRAVSSYDIPAPTGDHDSLVEYDRLRTLKESLLDHVINTSVDTADAQRVLGAMVCRLRPANEPSDSVDEEQQEARQVLAGILRGDGDDVQEHWDALIEALLELPLLYVPIAKAGSPARVVTARVLQRAIQDLLTWLPRLGLVTEACQLIETAREMERLHPIGAGAVTEFDELFKIGYKSLVEMIIRSSSQWDAREFSTRGAGTREGMLVECLKQLTESLLSSWLAHSKTLRLSVLERAKDQRVWNDLVAFVERYGAEIFTQRFLNLSNLRAILHQGVSEWLEQILEERPLDIDWQLLDDVEDHTIKLEDAADILALILEAVVENYGEYRDYNSMTTQSDRGELLYTLLDFLRLRTEYDRICWQLKPVVWAHELLVRNGRDAAAAIWRHELSQQTRLQADKFLQRLSELQQQYAMRMPTVADRLGERFVRPMAIDRIRALVRPAIHEATHSDRSPSFELLVRETDTLTRVPTGVGLDVPAWLVALEDEVNEAVQPTMGVEPQACLAPCVPIRRITLDEMQRQLEGWSSRKEA